MGKKRFAYFTVTFVVLFALINCSKTEMSGKYISEKNPKDYLELKSDGTFFYQHQMGAIVGKYEIEGDQITIKTNMGISARGKIQGKTIIDEDGDRWTKQEIKALEPSIVGMYFVQNTEGKGKLVPGTYIKFNRDGTFTFNFTPFKWKMEGRIIKIRNGNGKEGAIGMRVLNDTIEDPQSGEVTWVKQEGAELIKKIDGSKLWSKYIFKYVDIKKVGLSLEFKKDGTGALASYGIWEAEGNNLKVIGLDRKELEGKIKGNIIEIKGFGTLVKRTRGANTFILTVIVIIGFLVIFAGILIARKIFNPSVSRAKVVSTGPFCTHCGKQNPISASFCTNCGRRLG